MKIQKLITDNDRVTWERNVNHFLRDGWTIVPSTLKFCYYCDGKNGAYSNAGVYKIFVVVLEKELLEKEKS